MNDNNDIIIKAIDLTKKFGSFVANDNLNFEVKQNEIFGFLGANGAGKTTAMRIMCGLSKPSSGEINVAGFNVYTQSEKIKKKIGYMCQKFSLYEDLTVFENIRFYGGIYGMSRKDIRNEAGRLLQDMGINKYRNSLIASLPMGWKQKLAFLIAIIHKPKIVFLDEPTGGVDPITRRQFWDLIYKASHDGITVFVTTHYMDEAEYCDRISIMVDGKIVALDTPENLTTKYKSKNMDEVFIKLARKPVTSNQ